MINPLVHRLPVVPLRRPAGPPEASPSLPRSLDPQDRVTLGPAPRTPGKILQGIAAATALIIALSACAPPGAGVAVPSVASSVPQPVSAQVVEKAPEPVVEIERPPQENLPLRGQGANAYHLTTRELEAKVSGSLTADQLPPGSPRFTAAKFDPVQASKLYPEGQVAHLMTGGIKECTDTDWAGECQKTRDNLILYKHISCKYRNEETGEKVRILQRSPFHMRTPEMEKSVCGGHRLVKDEWGYQPVQTDSQGQTLYLNPSYIVKVQVVD